MDVLLDTNIVIGYLAGDPEIALLFDAVAAGRITIGVSVVTEYELLRFPQLTPDQEVVILRLLNAIRVVDVNRRIAQRAALLSREYRGTTTDLLLAATAMDNGVRFLTRNIRDFKKIHGLNLVGTVLEILS